MINDHEIRFSEAVIAELKSRGVIKVSAPTFVEDVGGVECIVNCVTIQMDILLEVGGLWIVDNSREVIVLVCNTLTSSNITHIWEIEFSATVNQPNINSFIRVKVRGVWADSKES